MIIFAAFAVLATLLLLILIRAPLSWKGKVALTVLVLSFSFTQWSALDSYRGWPAAGAVPPRTQFIACLVTEPSQVDGVTGVIYLWLIPLRVESGIFYYRTSTGEPRAYREPYTEQLQQACQTAQALQKAGLPAGFSGGATGARDPGRYHAYVLPKINPPIKEAK